MLAAVLGAVLSGGLMLGTFSELPPGAVALGVAMLGLLPVALLRWRFALWLFLVWVVVEDLLRKLAGNDIWIALIKDGVFLVVVASLIASKEARGVWKEATGKERVLLYLLVGWALALSVPSALEDWRLPLVGLRLDFFYIPLVIAGYLLISKVRAPDKWLLGLALLGGVASLIGVIQAVVGPDFLSPQGPVRGLPNLVLERGVAESGPVYRPTGTFVDPGRFASMALVAMAIGLAAYLVARRNRAIALGAAIASAAAVWVSGGRAGFVFGVVLVMTALLAPYLAQLKRKSGRATLAAASGIIAVVGVAAFFPTLGTSRAIWYQETLDPRSPRNEWTMRFTAVWDATVDGIHVGGLLGRGTGSHSLGLQYLESGEQDPLVEGGYATVAVEWGLIGLVLWVVWSVMWVRRQWRSIKASRGVPLSSAGVVLFAWILFFLFFGFYVGFQGYQNYIGNAYFWLISGMIFALPAVANRASEEQAAASQTP